MVNLNCNNCQKDWDYQGSAKYWASCPNCKWKVSLKHLNSVADAEISEPSNSPADSQADELNSDSKESSEVVTPASEPQETPQSDSNSSFELEQDEPPQEQETLTREELEERFENFCTECSTYFNNFKVVNNERFCPKCNENWGMEE